MIPLRKTYNWLEISATGNLLKLSWCRKEGNNSWKGTFPLDPGKYQYKFVVDGEWKLDPCNPEVITSNIGANHSLGKVS